MRLRVLAEADATASARSLGEVRRRWARSPESSGTARIAARKQSFNGKPARKDPATGPHRDQGGRDADRKRHTATPREPRAAHPPSPRPTDDAYQMCSAAPAMEQLPEVLEVLRTARAPECAVILRVAPIAMIAAVVVVASNTPQHVPQRDRESAGAGRTRCERDRMGHHKIPVRRRSCAGACREPSADGANSTFRPSTTSAGTAGPSSR